MITYIIIITILGSSKTTMTEIGKALQLIQFCSALQTCFKDLAILAGLVDR